MQMYKVKMLPLAEEDIMNNTDYIAFKKNWTKTKNWRLDRFENAIIRIIKYISL